jgi:hypothetical protein
MADVQRNGTGVSAEFAEKNNNSPVNPTDIANKQYVDTVAQGLSPKDSVVAATTGALPAYAYLNGVSGVGATLTKTAPFAALPAQDGVTLQVGDRLLVKNETVGNAPYNGIYVVTALGSGVAAWVLTRALDNDQAAEFPGAYTFVEEGTVNGAAGFVCTTPAPVIVGTTAITWTQFTGASEITAGNGLTKSGNTISVLPDGSTLTVSGSGVKVTDGGIGTTQLANAGVTNAKLANMAANSIKGNNTGGSAAPSDLTVAQVNTLLGTLLANGTVSMTGDLNMGGNNITNVGSIGGVAITTIATWQWQFGDGADSTLTLGSNTTLSTGANVKRYSSLDLNGFTFNHSTSDNFLIIYVSGTLNLNGGKIFSQVGSAGSNTSAGSGGATGGGTAPQVGTIFVFANTIIGTGSIRSGVDGANGGNAPGGGGSTSGGNGGAPNSSYALFGATRTATSTSTAGGGGTVGNGAGGTAGTGVVPQSGAAIANNYKNINAWLNASWDLNITSTGAGNTTATGSGAGGSTGVLQNSGFGGGGGGGGGAGVGSGGAGGQGGTGSGSTAGHPTAGGGGGGGGSGGGVVVVVTNSASSGLTVDASGGKGGNGGNAFGDGTNQGGAGAGGGGGGGGLAILIGNSGNSAQCLSNGGAAGGGGTGAGGGAAGTATAGNAGIAMKLVR